MLSIPLTAVSFINAMNITKIFKIKIKPVQKHALIKELNQLIE